MTMVAMTDADFHERMRQLRRSVREAVATFVGVASRGDIEGMAAAIAALQSTGAWAAAFRAVGKIEAVPHEFQQAFVLPWVQHGNGFRDDVNDDQALKLGLRRLLPRYNGPSVTLYRGDSAFNRRRRSYGLSWSSDIDVARSFALGAWRAFEGGSVLLRCDAPPRAILCAINANHEHYGENEFLVDSRLAGRIVVVERFSQTSL